VGEAQVAAEAAAPAAAAGAERQLEEAGHPADFSPQPWARAEKAAAVAAAAAAAAAACRSL